MSIAHPVVRLVAVWAALAPAGARPVRAQSGARQVKEILDARILAPDVAVFQVKRLLVNSAAPPPLATTAEQWRAEAERLREDLLRRVVFHGWPREWVDAPPRFEETGVIETGHGYRIRKLRYEIVPGFWSAALLYEPDRVSGKAPGIVNVNGHVGPPGKAVEYKQTRCINFAKRGIFALNLEWMAFGELDRRGNEHAFAAHLDLVGTQGLGLFYLAMRKGLDYLWDHPDVDRKRIGMTGLSGGGWQTIVLSALDERVAVSVPVAGFASTRSRVEARERGDLGDLEQSATDFLAGVDYPHLVALRAPRPTLLVYNAEDDCCFRAPLARPDVFDAIRPLFRTLGAEDALAWHENLDPGDHNYQRDNRLAAYRFFATHFGLPPVEDETAAEGEVRAFDELVVGLPEDNLTTLELARRLASGLARSPAPTAAGPRREWAVGERAKLRDLLRYRPAAVSRPWLVASTKSRGIESLSYLLETDDGLAASAVLLKGTAVDAGAPVTLVLHDQGRSEAGALVSDRVNRGEQVVAADLFFFGEAWKEADPAAYAQILHGTGRRALGLQAAHLNALVRWLGERRGGLRVRLEASGMRSQGVALAAAAIEPELYSAVAVRDGLSSWGELLEKPIEFREAPELFCLDLYREFDLDRLGAVADGVSLESASSGDPRPW